MRPRILWRVVTAAWLVSIVFTGILALHHPTDWLVIQLTTAAVIVVVLFEFACSLADRTVTSNQHLLKGWQEQEELTIDLTHLLGESLERLSTWDRETADEIADRTNTVIRLRFQNFNERNHP